MTSEDERLDRSIIDGAETLTLYRIVRAKYANLSGVGAALYPGRWNQLGEEAIYTSLDPITPQWERLVHTPKNMIPVNLVMMEIQLDLKPVPNQEVERIEQRASAHDWFCVFPTLRFAREHSPNILWTKYSSLIALAVPSVIVPKWNVVLYPQCASFWKCVSLKSIEPFQFDPRLFPDDTPVEPLD